MINDGAVNEAIALHRDLAKTARKVQELRGLLVLAAAELARHHFVEGSDKCVLCGEGDGFAVARTCTKAHDYELLKRIVAALEE